jgi:hypothetical protein
MATTKEKEDCDWCLMRAISLKPRPINKAEWEVVVSKDSRMFAGKTIVLCSYHKSGLALKFDSVKKLQKETT